MSAEWLDPLVQRLGWTRVNFTWQGALVGVLPVPHRNSHTQLLSGPRGGFIVHSDNA